MLEDKNKTRFDIVIPVGINEIPIIHDVVKYIEQNVENYNKIYLISCEENLYIDNCVTINEKIFPFSKESIEEVIGPSPRISWIFQQLLKLYSPRVLTECLDNILIIDADVYVLNKLKFFKDYKPIFTVGYENTEEYHVHSQKLHPNISRIHQRYSGVSHHMMLNRIYMAELFQLVEEYHKDQFLKVFLISLDTSNRSDIRCSEYEIYFNFMCYYHPHEIYLRELRWANVPYLLKDMGVAYDYVSVPKWFGTR